MNSIFPQKLKKGDKIAVIAPSDPLSIISHDTREIANKTFRSLGLEVVFGKHVESKDDAVLPTVEDRINDLHWAFKDPRIKAIFTAIGGYSSNKLLSHIDWKIIKSNPKIFCGYSDITVLSNAIFKMTEVITYSGPHYSTLGQKKELEYTIANLVQCFFQSDVYEILPSDTWTDDEWWINQNDRNIRKNKGWKIVNPGITTGKVAGGNLSSFRLLQGTRYMPDLKGAILFLEEEGFCDSTVLDRELQSLIHQNDFNGVKGIVIGRFQKNSSIHNQQVAEVIKSKKELNNIPVLIDVDFGHTNPMFTFPIGGIIKLNAFKDPSIELTKF